MITLAITNYNRCELLFESFIKVINDDRISEIIINDDKSEQGIYDSIIDKLESLKKENISFNKVKIYKNENNMGQFLNSKKAVELSNNEWVILLDSDNVIDVDYINVVYNLKDNSIIYLPSHAICESHMLNYTQYSNTLIDKLKYKQLLSNRSIWDSIFNTGNFYFNKYKYLECVNKEECIINSYGGSPYYLIYLWMKNGDNSKILITENLKYIHRLDHRSFSNEEGSLYIKNASNTGILVNKLSSDISRW